MNRLSDGKTDFYIGTSVCIANVTPDCVSQFVTGLESGQRVFWGETSHCIHTHSVSEGHGNVHYCIEHSLFPHIIYN
jgi:hypothetical protein